jgi:hypothetical protein
MDVFARPVRITPRKSAPGRAPFDARGIWAIRPADIQLDDGGTIGTDQLTLGIRGSEFDYVPVKGDLVFIPAYMSQPEIGECEIEDDGYDGQGGYNLVLRKRD